jgi:hypothetical protein
MTRKTTKHSNPTEKKSKRLSVSKQTLKDLGVSGRAAKGVKGGRANRTNFSCDNNLCISINAC